MKNFLKSRDEKIHNRMNYNFYAGVFNYTKEKSDSKGNKSSTTYIKNYFCIKIPKKLKTRFYLFTNGTGVSSSELKSKPVKTESISFNRNFNLSYNDKTEKALEVVKTLSPAMQVRLSDMLKARGPFGILFSEECVCFIFNGLFFNRFETDLYRSIDIDPDDKKYFETRFSELVSLTTDMIKYID